MVAIGGTVRTAIMQGNAGRGWKALIRVWLVGLPKFRSQLCGLGFRV